MAIGFFDGDARNSSPEAVKRKREIIARMLTGRAPRNVGEGFAAIGDGIAAAMLGYRADTAEKAGMEEARRLQSAAFGGMGAPGGGGGMASAAPVSRDQEGVARTVYDRLVSGGLSPVAAAGLVGNIQKESSFNTGARNPGDGRDGSDSIGLVQWNSSRANALKAMAAQRGVDWRDPGLQADFILQELRGPERRAYEAMQAARTPEEAGRAAIGFFRPAGFSWNNPMGGHNAAARVAAATNFAQRFGGQPTAPMPMVQGRPTAPMPTAQGGPVTAPMPVISPSSGNDMGGMTDAGASDAAAVDMGAPVPVPVAETEADVQALEAQMASPDMAALFAPQAMGAPSAFMPAGAPAPAPVEAPPPQMDRATFDAITATQAPAQPAFMAQGVAPSWGGQNADLPAQGAAGASLPAEAIPQPPRRPVDLAPQSPFIPPQMRQPMPDVRQGTEQGGVGMYDALTPSQAPQMAQSTAGAPMAAQMAPQASVNVGASGAVSQAVPASGGSNANIAALLASPFVSREVKQFALAELQQRQALQMQEAERARARGDSEAAARAAGLDPALVGDKTILGQAAQARFNRLNNQPKRSLQPVFATDAQGNTVMLQPGEDGTAVQTKMPEGVKIASGVDKVDAGTEFILIDKRTGNVVGRQPKDIAGAERQKVLGKDEGERITNAPGEIRVADQALATIEQIRSHKGRDGWGAQGRTASLPWINRGIPGTEGRDFVALVEQAQGQAFLQAFESLKGGGQITQTEGEQATKAIARLDRTQSRAGFDTALKDIEGMLRLARDRAQRRVRVLPDGTEVPMGNSPSAPAPSGPRVISVEPVR